MNNDLNDLMVFVKVAKFGSFTRAAEFLGIPKSNVSRKITRLEANLSVKLIERSTRTLHLTEMGKVYYQHCLRIQEELENAEQSLESHKTAITGTLTVCASVTIGQHLIAPLVAEFKVEQPQIKLALSFINRKIDLIEDGVDLAISVGESADSTVESKKLTTLTMSLYVSKHYLEAVESYGSCIQSIEDLKDHPSLYLDSVDAKALWSLIEGNEEHLVPVEPEITANDLFTLKILTEQGLGIALLPDYLAENSNTLVKVLPNYVGQEINLYATYSSRKGVSPKLDAFLAFLTAQLG